MQTDTKRPAQHPDLPAEQAVIDFAYQRLEEIRSEATSRAESAAAERPTHFQLAYERDVAVQAAYERAAALDIGDQSLVFGRIDREDDERYYIGRRAVFDRGYRPLVIDWRVPTAEPFYRATGRHPMSLRMRRHFLCEGRLLLAIEDEHFGDGRDLGLAGSGALLAAMERPRTGHMRDIVATVQAEQDEVIRDELTGVLIVQGGPGTGKTAVGLHRAAYLLFTHRQKLERQGILVVGPTRRFLRYIDQVLPALGEGGVDLSTLAGLAPAVEVRAEDPEAVARLKGDSKMAGVLKRALAAHQRQPRRGLQMTFEAIEISLSKKEVSRLTVAAARTRRRSHNARRAMLLNILVQRLRRRYELGLKKRYGELAPELRLPRGEAGRRLRAEPALQSFVEEIWPMLTPQAFVGALLSSREQLRAAGLTEAEAASLVRADPDAWTSSDIPLLDEAAALLGAPVDRRRVVTVEDDDTDELETYGHIIVDEAQDLTPMALRMLARRSRTGSMTLVGDLAQTVGATLPHSWNEVLAHLPARDGARVRELTVNYRTPGPIMEAAVRVLAEAAPELAPPRSARPDGEPITFIHDDPAPVVAEAADQHRAGGEGTVCVIADRSMLEQLRAAARALDAEDDTFAILDVQEAKGLEFDRVIVVEPARIAGGTAHGLRALYVALTRATRHVTIVHSEPLPPALREVTAPAPS